MSIFKPARRLVFTLGVLSTVPLAALAIRGEGTAPLPGEAPPAAGPESPEGAAPESRGAAEEPPFDVNEVIRRVRFSYREEADGWRADHPAYDVRATAGGVTLTPVHAAAAEPADLAVERLAPPRPAEVVEGAPLVLGAARVTRGDARLDSEQAHGEVEPDGHLALQRGAVVEHLHNTPAGVEQSWSFETPPPGAGALEVEIPIDGMEYKMSTSQGLHFADARTGLGFQYGHGTWIDAQGRRTPVMAEYEDGHIQLRVPESVLAGSAYPAVLDPVISAELTVDGRFTTADAADQQDPAVAYDGTNFLVVWRTRRPSGYHLYGARISDTGVLLDPQGFLLSNGLGNATSPAVASNGAGFFVAWNALLPDTSWHVRGTHVSSAGAVAWPGGVEIAATRGRQYVFPQVASNGTDYLTTWYVYGDASFGQTHDVGARRISAAGEPVGAVIPIASSPAYNELLPAVASNGDGYLVIWSDDRDAPPGWEDWDYRARAARVSNTGEILDPGGFRLSGESMQYTYAVASNGQDYLAVWMDHRSGQTRDVYGTRVTAGGAVVDGDGLAIGVDTETFVMYPAAASDGADYFVAWTAAGLYSNSQQTRGTRVSSTLSGQAAVIDYPGTQLSPPNGHMRPAIAHSGAGYLVVWDGVWDDRPGRRELYHCRIPGTQPERIPITGVASSDQTEPAVASDGYDFLVVWTDTGPSGNAIYGVHVAADGTLLDRTPLNIATAPRERGAPSVASNGQDYLVTWMDFRDINWDIFGARVLSGAAGQSAVLDPNGFAISQHPAFQNAPDVASDGNDYLVVWRQALDGRGNVHGARVTNEAVVLDPAGIAIATNAAEHYTPRAAGNEDGYLVVWAEYRGATSWDVLGRRVSAAGAVLDASALVVSDGAREQYDPDVASDGDGYLVVWTDYRSNTSNDVYGARVTAEGVTLDPAGIALTTHPAQQVGPKVAFDGANYVAVWVDQRWSQNWHVIGTAVSAGGAVSQPDGWSLGWELGAPAGLAPAAAIAGTGDGRVFAAYPKYDVWPNQGSRRIRGTVATF